MLGLQSRVLMYQVCVVLKTTLLVTSQGGLAVLESDPVLQCLYYRILMSFIKTDHSLVERLEDLHLPVLV